MSSKQTRRDFLQVLATGAAGLAAGHVTQAATIPRRSDSNAAKHLILIHLSGGPSHIDTFDPKPAAPVEYRNLDPACQTSIPGVCLSENLPRLASRLADVSLIRSLHHDGPATHEAGLSLIQSGQYSANHSGITWDRLIADQFPFHASLPNHVILGASSAQRRTGSPSIATGFGNGDDVSNPISNLATRSSTRFANEDVAAQATRLARISHERSHRDYGSHAIGRDCLRARVLIERGVPVVTIHQFGSVYDQVTWDMHANGGRLRTTHEDYRQSLCPQLDQALSALLDDLRETGLLNETIVVAVGEMGRTPRINAYGGRDHHSAVWTGLIAGGPIHSGQIIGASDANGDQPRDRPISPAEFGATICHAMGVVNAGDKRAIQELICQ